MPTDIEGTDVEPSVSVDLPILASKDVSNLRSSNAATLERSASLK